MGWFRRIGDWGWRVFRPSTARGRRVRFERAFVQARDAYAGGRYEDADRLFQQALRIAEEPRPPGAGSGDLLARLGDFFHSVGNYRQAEELIQRSLAIRERSLPPESTEVLASLNELALLHYAQGKYAEAETLYLRLLPVLENHRGPEDREVAICLDNYAAVLRKLKRDDEAAKAFARAREIRKKLRGEG